MSRCAVVVGIAWGCALLASGHASGAACPVEPGASSGTPAYEKVGNRCEGFLPFFVNAGGRIELLGLHRGVPTIDGTQSKPVRLRVAAKQAPEGLAIRATYRTRQLHYQMDTLVAAAGQGFEWDMGVVAKASKDLASQPSFFAFLACDSECRFRPTTTFWPVTTTSVGEKAVGPVYAVLRTNLAAEDVSVRLRSASGPGATALPNKALVLRAGLATQVPTPRVVPGEYELIVEAKTVLTGDHFAPLVARVRITADDE